MSLHPCCLVTGLTRNLRVFLFRVSKTTKARKTHRKRNTWKSRRACKVHRDSKAQGHARHIGTGGT